MKCLLWKCWILTVALALVLVLGAFAEGSMSLPLAAALCLAGYRILRAAWAAEQRAERQAARRATRRRAPAAARPRRPPAGAAAPPAARRVGGTVSLRGAVRERPAGRRLSQLRARRPLSWTGARPFSSVFSAPRCEIAGPVCTCRNETPRLPCAAHSEPAGCFCVISGGEGQKDQMPIQPRTAVQASSTREGPAGAWAEAAPPADPAAAEPVTSSAMSRKVTLQLRET